MTNRGVPLPARHRAPPAPRRERQHADLAARQVKRREQTRAIHRIQREAQTLEGLFAKRRRQEITTLHRNAQRLLKPISVVNPHADRLTFPDSLTRTRRDHMKFLTLIRAVTLLSSISAR